MKLEYLYWDTNIYNTIAIMFIEWTIKKHSKIATANNYHINVMYKIKWNCERHCGDLLFDHAPPTTTTTEKVDDACDR